MLRSTAKKGRPQASHRTSWGERIDGLSRLADGRWKVSGPTPIKFTEPDERLAVARFQQIMAERNSKSNIGTVQVHMTAEDAMIDMLSRAKEAGGVSTDVTRPKDGPKGVWAVSDETLSTKQWAWLRHQIIKRPKWVAERIGIEKIGWLSDLQEPVASPTLKEVGDLYANKLGLSANEACRSKLFWKEFSKAVAVKTIREIKHEQVAAYEKVVQGGNYAPKSILHRYRKVRTILAYSIKRGRGTEDCRRALDVTAMLEVKNHTPLDPKPIGVDDFNAIHRAAVSAGDKTFAAMLLVALNAAMYAGEVSALKWDEIDLKTRELVTRRPKTGVSRVAMLWPETVKAIRELPRINESVFNTKVRSYTVFSAMDSWRKYRKAADLKEELVFGQVRDAAFTIACRSGLDQARVLAGHRLPGASDHYVRRNPAFVAAACNAIRAAFMARKN
jgi:integrase